jgi:hypothetical protein
MKKTIPALLLACVLFACKKGTNSDDSAPSSDAKVPVKFSVENFLVSQQDMSENGRVETDTSLSGFFRLSYLAFASNGNKATYYYMDSTVNNFGVISDSLAPGTYTIAIGAHKRLGLRDTYVDAGFSSTQNKLSTAQFYSLLGWNTGDFFYKKLQVTVSAYGNPGIIDVSLNRIIGNLKIELKDVLPASDPNEAVTVEIFGVPQSYMINADTTDNLYPYFIPINRTSRTTWEYNIFGSNKPITVKIGWKDKITGAAQSKTFSNVQVNANKKTMISGYLYGVPQNVGGGDLYIRTNKDWSTDSTFINFN